MNTANPKESKPTSLETLKKELIDKLRQSQESLNSVTSQQEQLKNQTVYFRGQLDIIDQLIANESK